MAVESLACYDLASPDLQWGIQPIVWERWAKGSGYQKGIIGGLLVYKHLNSTMDHVRNICRIGEAVSTRMLNQHPSQLNWLGLPCLGESKGGQALYKARSAARPSASSSSAMTAQHTS